MEIIIETFKVEWRLLIAQAVNFAIVFFVLYRFIFRPLAKVMAERTEKITKSLDDAKLIEKKLAETKSEYDVIIAEAKKEATEIISNSNKIGEQKRTEIINKAKEEIGQIINQEKAKIQAEKAIALKEIKKEVADLVALSVGKILEEKIDIKKDQELIKKILK